jgi:uncharacterized damage-inducible protein DinB
MMHKLNGLFAHMRWADQRVLETLLTAHADADVDRATNMYAHVLGAENVWINRLRGSAGTIAVWPSLSSAECAQLARENADAYDAFITGLSAEDLGRMTSYTNSTGVHFQTRVDDILLHVAMHGAYHRGQIAMLLRDAGAEPLATDYIAFVRSAENS